MALHSMECLQSAVTMQKGGLGHWALALGTTQRLRCNGRC